MAKAKPDRKNIDKSKLDEYNKNTKGTSRDPYVDPTKDTNYPDEDKPPRDYFNDPGMISQFPRRHDIDLKTPEQREKMDSDELRMHPYDYRPTFQDEGTDPDYLSRPGAAYKYNKRNKDIELPHEGPTIKIEVSAPKRKRSVGNY